MVVERYGRLLFVVGKFCSLMSISERSEILGGRD